MRHVLLRLAVLLMTWVGAPASAADPAGLWALRAGDTTLMLFEIVHTPQGWRGAWSQPAHYRTDRVSFRQIEGAAVRRTARTAHALPDGIDLVFDNPVPGRAPDHLIFRPQDANTARLTWATFDSTPFLLTREATAPALGPWPPDRVYIPDRPTDPEMTAIFDADQSARGDPAKIDWSVLLPADRGRRARTQVLLDAGRLASADDFYHAAFVFQHGEQPEDFLKAHALAMIAAARGQPDAGWIAAATLDRYLQRIGQSQIFGTQFSQPSGKDWTQEPYRRDILPDALRRAAGVPPLAEQEEQRKEWARTFGGSSSGNSDVRKP